MTGGNDPSLYKTSKDGPILGFDLEMLKRKHAEEEAETKKELGLNPKTNKPATGPSTNAPPADDADDKNEPSDAPVTDKDNPDTPQGNLSDVDFNEIWGE